MQISELSQLAILAKLSADKEELQKVLPQLEKIASFFDEIQEAPCPVSSENLPSARLRPDEIMPSLSPSKALGGTGNEEWFVFETKGEKST